MTDREKLVEMINHVCEGHAENLMQPYGVETLADHLIANGVTVQKWIPVENRLPKKLEYVLALNEYDEGAQEPCIAYIHDRGWIAAGVIGCKITHWMPLQPLKEANHETD